MAIPAHMTLEGEKQGKIDGSCDIKGREKTVIVHAFEHKVHMPTDKRSGRAMNNAFHGQFVVYKEFDASSPKLYKALSKGERIKTVELKWYRITPAGKQEQYFTQKLENAYIVEMSPVMHDARETGKAEFGHLEKVCFTYDKIRWTYEPDGIVAEASWTDDPSADA